MKILIKNGIVVDPSQEINCEVMDILLQDSKISKISRSISSKVETIIDASGKMVLPGLVDMHVHLREPGREDKETIASGTKAALKGGVTSVLAMPNTSPAIDSPQAIELLKNIIKNQAQANVFIASCITRGRLGKELIDIGALKKQGAVAISDDGSSVDDEKLLLEALKKAWQVKSLVICHCEDKLLSNHGVVNLGVVSTKLGLRGISKESEYKRIERDIGLAEKSGQALHIAHLSCKESVDIVSRAKKRGVKVTCETAPHYFSLTQEAVCGYDTNLKMNPPLRGEEDVEAIKQGLRSGTVDVIASDHAPHTENEKDIEFDRAEFGVIGLETELAVSITELVHGGILSWQELVKKMAMNPAKILGIDKGTLQPGKDADITIVSADLDWVVQKDAIVSKSKNSPFLGRNLKGVVEYAICGGKIAFRI